MTLIHKNLTIREGGENRVSSRPAIERRSHDPISNRTRQHPVPGHSC